MTSSHDLMSIGASLDVDRSVTDRHQTSDGHRQTHEHRFGEGSYTIAPKGAKTSFPSKTGEYTAPINPRLPINVHIASSENQKVYTLQVLKNPIDQTL